MEKFHEPVLLKEVIQYLGVKKGEKYIDATVGGGGHTAAILKLGGKVLGIDCDPEAIKAARTYLASACPPGKHCSWRLVRGNFKDIFQIAKREGFLNVSGILFDLGVSSYQLETAERGFSFNLKGPLDMRMDPSLRVTAADLVNGLNKGELDELFSKFGQEHYSRRLAEAIIRARSLRPIKTTGELVEIINQALPTKRRRRKLHPATRVFQALRIAVNDELNNLKKSLPQALDLLKPKGRLVVISFHSGEDRIVKQQFKAAEEHGLVRIITDKPVRPTAEEIKRNPRSRSAKLRVGEKMRKISLPILIIILVLGLALVQLVITHRLATAGETIREIEIKAARIEDKNELIRREINQLGSLKRIAQEAERLGFVPNHSFLHLTPEIPVAMNY